MNPRTKLAFFNDDEDESINIQVKPLDDQKAKTFSQGIHRKSKREKEKEAEAAKREEEEREAAKAYAEFLDEFEGPSANKTNAFVRASDSSGTTSTYTPSMSKDIPTGPRSRQRDPSPPPDAQPKPKGKRAMDAFLEELKRDQADREARLKKQTTVTGRSVSALAAYESQVGSRDRGDPLTTNVFVSNLPTTITEHSMGMFFAKMGPVGSVKIMWPRGDHNGGPGGDITSRRKTSGMSGFVSYMARSSAEACVREMDGYTWNGSVLRVGWSRAVPIAAKPMYDLSDVKEKEPRHGRSRSRDRPTKRRKYSRSRSKGRYESRSRSRSRSRDRHRKRSTSYSRSRSRSRSPRRRKRYSRKSRSRSRSYSTSRSRSDSRSRSRSRSDSRERRNRRRSHSRSYSRRSDDRRRSDYRSRSRSRSRSPAIEQRRWPPIPSETKSFITTISNKVKNHGKAFENVMKQREKDNPKFVFMHDSKLPEYHFYKSLVDPNYRCPYADIPFEDEGDMSVYSTDSGEESERERTRKGTLGRIAKRRFETMLRSMTGRRGEIARCMAFSLEHADAVEDVADIITSSICVTNTPVPRKVARLHVICDILHNGAATIPNVWKFRQEFQLRLPDVFDHLSTIYHSFPGRITAETFKKQIVSVVEIWEDWIVFPHEFTTELRNRLDGVTTTGDAGGGSAGGGTKEKKSEDTKSTSQPSAPSKFTSGGFKPATEPVTAFDHKSATGIASGDDEAMSIDGDDVGDEDLDGMAVDGKGMDDDLDGGDLDGEYIST